MDNRPVEAERPEIQVRDNGGLFHSVSQQNTVLGKTVLRGPEIAKEKVPINLMGT